MTLERFDVMTIYLTGQSIPPLPAIEGRVVKAPDFDDADQAPPPPARCRSIPRRRAMTRAELERCAGPEPPKPG